MPRLATDREADRERQVQQQLVVIKHFVDLIEFVCEFQHFKKPIFVLAFD